MPQAPPRPTPEGRCPTINGAQLTSEQWDTLQSGGHIWLENMDKADGSGKYSAYVFLDDEKKRAHTSLDNPDEVFESRGLSMRIRDIVLLDNGYVIRAKVIDPDETAHRHLFIFIWRDPETDRTMSSPNDPRIPKEAKPEPPPPRPMVIKGVELTPEQRTAIREGGHVWLDGMTKADGSLFSAHAFYDDERKRIFFCKGDPDKFVKYGVYEMRLRDKVQVANGFMTQATVRWLDGNVARPFVWKDKAEDTEYKLSFHDPRLPENEGREPEIVKLPPPAPRYPVINGVEITAEQYETLRDGGHVWLENMVSKDGDKLSAYAFLDDEKQSVFYSYDRPDKFVKYGMYEMRLRDKMLIERGYTTKAVVKWSGGTTARPYLWKENPADEDYKISWEDPRLPKEEQDRQRRERLHEQEQNRWTIPQKNSRGMKV